MAFDIRLIDVPSWARTRDREALPPPNGPITAELYDLVQARRPEFLAAIHRTLATRVDRCALTGSGLFPQRDVLTGEYYLSRDESYSFRKLAGRAQVIVQARFLGRDDELRTPGEADDYMGIDVSVEFNPDTDAFEAEAFSLQVLWSNRALGLPQDAEPGVAPDAHT